MPLIVSCIISNKLQDMAFYFRLLEVYGCMHIATLIGLVVLRLITLSLVIAFCLVLLLFHGNPRSSPSLYVLLPKLSIVPWPLLAVNYNGYLIFYITYPSSHIVVIRLLFTLLQIPVSHECTK
jgi:hypothetical protein